MEQPPAVLLWARLLGYLERRQARPVQRAYLLARLAHEGQMRDGEDGPYISHPLRVALILAEEVKDRESQTLCVALLHDVLEDSSVAEEEIARACGAGVLEAVRLLTKQRTEPNGKEARDQAYYAAICAGPPVVQYVKCADRLDNLRSMRVLNDPVRLARYIDETRRYILPVAAVANTYLHQALLEECAARLPTA